MSINESRPVTDIVTAHRQMEGGGFIVRRPIPSGNQEQVDPFLLLDEMGPMDYAPGEAKGAPDHPHRGFETVTYLLDGEMEHEDSSGHRGVLRPGDVQWMTAGAGVVHSELPTQKMLTEGGRMHGFQLWVNLPAKDKMMEPRYQEITAAELPTAKSSDGKAWVRLIAGEALGKKALIETRIPIVYQHWKLEAGSLVHQAIPAEQDAFVYVFSGSASIGEPEETIDEGQMAVLGPGESVTLRGPQQEGTHVELLLLAAKPLREPMVRWGPFVMNHPQEIQQAISDYQAGTMGKIVRTDT
jgi:quercetin 2,3-dioxygenase